MARRAKIKQEDVPARVVVLGRLVDVVVTRKVGDDPSEELWGYSDLDHNIIQLSAFMTKENCRSTLIHEIIHFILHNSGLATILDNDAHEEAVVRALESGLSDAVDLEKLLPPNAAPLADFLKIQHRKDKV